MEYSKEQLQYLLAMQRMPGIGPRKLSELLETFNASKFTDPGSLQWEGAEKDLAWMEMANCHIISHRHSAYPARLKEIPGSPPFLFVWGDLKILSRIQIAIVGSRNPTVGGCESAGLFARHFSSEGITVTSGLALGIDAAAHKGALSEKGGTVAVLGNGLDQIYPATHRALAHEIIEKGGALVSEFPIGTPPAPSNFPRRNRIISGLSIGTLVVEAAIKSGSLVTAKYALEQGREVFAVPGSIHSPMVKGCHALIKQGAKLVETAEDVMEELGAFLNYRDAGVQLTLPFTPPSASRGTVKRLLSEKSGLSLAPASTLEEGYQNLLAQIDNEGTPIDALVARTGLTARIVSSMLIELELKGYVAPIPGGYLRTLG